MEAIASKQVGVGQLFRFIRALPSFHLIDADRLTAPAAGAGVASCDSGTSSSSVVVGNGDYLIDPPSLLSSSSDSPQQCLRRHYQLSCPQVSCEFVETFEPNFLDPGFLLNSSIM